MPGSGTQQDGTLLFLDVSGFTTLSERLARRGPQGTEELTVLVDAVLHSQVQALTAHGGEIASFGGDAILARFHGPRHEGRALAAAARAQQAMGKFRRLETTCGRVTLRMSAAVESGPVHDVTTTAQPRPIVVGATSTAVLRLEKDAAAGSVLVGPQALGRIIGRAVAGPRRLTPALLRRSAPPPPIEPGAHPPITAGDWDPQHRRVVVAFVRLTGLDTLVRDVPAALARSLDHDLRLVAEVCRDHGVHLWATDVEPDGLKVLLVAGAPVSAGDNGDRLLSALLQMRTRVTLPMQAGVHAGRVFMAELAGTLPGTGTVMGDAVNIAARLAAGAEVGAITATEQLLLGTRTAWRTDTPRELAVRGRHEPVSVLHVTGAGEHHRPRTTSGLEGRDLELDTMLGAITAALVGDGDAPRVIELIGPPGIGKSHLLETVQHRLEALAPETPQVRITGSTYALGSPFLAARGALRWLLGCGPDDEAGTAAALRRRAAADPHLPLVAEVWRVVLPPTPEVDALDPAYRREVQIKAAVAQLRAIAPRSVFVVEDAHWLDAGSRALLAALAADPEGGWVVVSAARPGAPELAADVQTVRLDPLAPEHAERVVRSLAPGLDDIAVDRIVTRGSGNPLFLTELARLAREGNTEDLPDSVEGVFAVTLDRLPSQQRRQLGLLSVLGARAPASLATALLDTAGLPLDDASRSTLDDAVSFSTGHVRFRHALLQESAYDTLARADRRRLHSLAADLVLEDVVPVEVDERSDLLARHLHLSGRHAESWRWSHEAARTARDRGATVEQLAFLHQARTDARRLADRDAAEVRALELTVAEAAELADQREVATAALRRAAALSAPGIERAVAMSLRGRHHAKHDSSRRALAWFRRALLELGTATGREVDLCRAEILTRQGNTYLDEGRTRRALLLLTEAIEIARGHDDLAVLGWALTMHAWATHDAGGSELTSVIEESIQVARASGDLRLLGTALSHAAAFSGSIPAAIGYATEGRDVRQTCGDLRGVAVSNHNLALRLLDIGEIQVASELLESSLASWRASGFVLGQAYAASNLGHVRVRQGRPDLAWPLFAQARDAIEGHGFESALIEVALRELECVALTGDPHDALRRADEVADLPDLPRNLARTAAILRGAALARLHDPDAVPVLTRVVADLRAQAHRNELGRALVLLGAVLGPHSDSGAAMSAEGRRILRDEGVPDLGPLLDPARLGWFDRLGAIAPAPT